MAPHIDVFPPDSPVCLKRIRSPFNNLGRQSYNQTGALIQLDENNYDADEFHSTCTRLTPAMNNHIISPSGSDCSVVFPASATSSPCSVDSQRPDHVSLPHSDFRITFLPNLNVPDQLPPNSFLTQPLRNIPLVGITKNSPRRHPQLPSISLSSPDPIPSISAPYSPVFNGYSNLPQAVQIHENSIPRISSGSENQPAPVEAHVQKENCHNPGHFRQASHSSQIQLQLLPSFSKSHKQPPLSLHNPLSVQNQSKHRLSPLSNVVSAGNWSDNADCVSNRHANASENRVGMFSPLVISQSSSLHEETEEYEPSAQTLALMDQPESEVTMYTCEFCRKTYQGKHARSIWRRHLSDKHKIPLATQPRRTRWDNDANRPQTDEERRNRTLESKRRWARKNRAAKKAARDAQRTGQVEGNTVDVNAEAFNASSRASTPSHEHSISPSSIVYSRPLTSNNRLLVHSANAGRSCSLQAKDDNSGDSMQPTPRLSSAPHQLGADSSSVSNYHPPSHNTSAPVSHFSPEGPFQFNIPISTGAYNIQSFPHNHFGAYGHQSLQGSGRAVLNEALPPTHNSILAHRKSLPESSAPAFQLVNPPFYSQQSHQSMYALSGTDSKDSNMRAPYETPVAYVNQANAPISCPTALNFGINFDDGGSSSMTRSLSNKRPRLSQTLSAPHVPMSSFSGLSGNMSSLSSSKASIEEYARSQIPTDNGSFGGEAHSEKSDRENAEECKGVERYDDEEEPPPMHSVDSSTRDSTGSCLNGDRGLMASEFDLSRFAHQTPARPTGLRAMMLRPEYGSTMNGAMYGESGLKSEASSSLYSMNLFDSPMVSRSGPDSSLHGGEFASMSISRSDSGLREHHQSAISSSGGSIDQWSSLETPCDSSHPARRDPFDFGRPSISSLGMTGHDDDFFDSRHGHFSSKNLGTAASGRDAMNPCIRVGILEPSRDVVDHR